MKTPTQEIVMKTFVVRLELEIDAATPTEAAQSAIDILNAGDANAVFNVFDQDGAYRVDAAELKKAS